MVIMGLQPVLAEFGKKVLTETKIVEL